MGNTLALAPCIGHPTARIHLYAIPMLTCATKQPVAGLIQAACCTHDEGRSLDIAIQVEVSNRLKRLRSRVVVVSVEETAGETCQV